MNLEDFQNSPTGRLALIEEDKKPYYAFVPKSLSPELELDNDMFVFLSKINLR